MTTVVWQQHFRSCTGDARKRSRRCPLHALVLIILLLFSFVTHSEAIFGVKSRRQRAKDALQRQEEERLAKLFVFLGIEIDKRIVHQVSGLLVLFFFFVFVKRRFLSDGGASKKIGNRRNEPDALDVIVVGCGLPKKGMGWYHLTQLVEMKNVNVRGVVEPFFENPNFCKEQPESWKDVTRSLRASGIEVVASVDELSSLNRSKKTMALIAGRTPDNPKLFHQCVEKGVDVIYLEKPGAPSVKELQQMKDVADANNVKVYLGYNKNVTPYVQKAIDLARQTPNSHVIFVHNNSYTRRDLPECFARNSEGMLKNMAIHELALLVTFFGVTVDTIEEFKVNTSKLFSEKLTTRIPDTPTDSPEYITDFSRIAFRVTTADGSNVSIMADRCGGNVSFAMVKDGKGREVKRFEFPDSEMSVKIEQQIVEDPEMMPYFHVQSVDYLELKKRVVNSAIENVDAEGVATIQVGIEALKLAEYGTLELTEALKS